MCVEIYLAELNTSSSIPITKLINWTVACYLLY